MLILAEVNNYRIMTGEIYKQNTELFLYVCNIRDTGIMVSYEYTQHADCM